MGDDRRVRRARDDAAQARERTLREQERQDRHLQDRVRDRHLRANEANRADEDNRADEVNRVEGPYWGGAPDLERRQPPGPKAGPAKPSRLPKGALWTAFKRTAREFRADNLSDWAAALTYYSVLSIFPGLLVLVAVVGLIGPATVQPLLDNITQIAPGAVRSILQGAAESLQGAQGAAGAVGIIGLLLALWSASRYVAGFMRASNAIYDVPEGRPIWKTLPIRLGVTVVTGILLVASAVIVVVTGDLAGALGRAIGLESTTVAVWNIAKWPVLLVLVAVMFALLYWASPNARQGGFRWVSPGGVLAVILWVAASGLFALYVANFSSYNTTYGTMAGIIIFLIWLWISNIALLLGAELDAELERQRAIAAGHPKDQEPYLQLRDTRKIQPGSDAGLG